MSLRVLVSDPPRPHLIPTLPICQMIDQHKIDLVSRMGGNWYCRADKNSMFEIQKPITSIGVGVDQIPTEIRNSTVLSGNDLGLLGSVVDIPDGSPTDSSKHKEAKELLAKDDVEAAWKVLLN